MGVRKTVRGVRSSDSVLSGATTGIASDGPSPDSSLPTSLGAWGGATGFTPLALSWPATSAVRLPNHPHTT